MRHPQGQDHINTTVHWVTGVMKSNSLFVSDRITSYALSYVTKYLITLTQSISFGPLGEAVKCGITELRNKQKLNSSEIIHYAGSKVYLNYSPCSKNTIAKVGQQ